MKKEEGSVDFYRKISQALGCEYECKKFPYSRRTRWNNREPGSGRYPGFGIVRRFSANCILINLHNPPINGIFFSEQAVLDAIQLYSTVGENGAAFGSS
jgi:hypothetical protein